MIKRGLLGVSTAAVALVLWFMRGLDRLAKFMGVSGEDTERSSCTEDGSGSSRPAVKVVHIQYDGAGAWVDMDFNNGRRVRFFSTMLAGVSGTWALCRCCRLHHSKKGGIKE